MKNTFENIQKRLTKTVLSKKASIISGIVCAIPFVFEMTFLLSYIAYIPLFYAFAGIKNEDETSVKKPCLYAFLFSFFYYVTGYSFLCELYPLDYAGFTQVEAMGVIILALTAVPLIHSTLFTVVFAVCRKCTSDAPDILKILVFPCVVVINEFLQSIGALAFPWCKVSVAQGAFLPMLQSASLFGPYFIAYIVLVINALLGFSLVSKANRKKAVIAALCVFFINLSFGTVRLALFDNGKDEFVAVSLQGNISSDSKWSGSTSDMLDEYIALNDEAMTEAKEKHPGLHVVSVMPETALPVTIAENFGYYDDISEYTKGKDLSLAVGAFSISDFGHSNSVFMFDGNGDMSEPYSKRILVPFGEYLPYRPILTAILPALAEINMLSSDLIPGDGSDIFTTPAGKICSAVCYESVFQNVVRKSVNDGGEILIIATNDSWFGTSSALKHHLVGARLRAIENGVPVIRAANTGISAIINADGSYADTLGADEKGYCIAPLSKRRGKTLYSYVGDVWLVVCFIVVIGCPLLKKANYKMK